MAGLRGYLCAVAAAFVGLAIGFAGSGAAGADTQKESYLYDRPVLAIETGAHTAAIRSQAVDAAGQFVVTGGDDRTVRIWSAADGRLKRTIRIPIGPENVGRIFAVAISPDGGTIAAGGWTGPFGNSPIYVFDRESGRLTKRIADDLPVAAKALAFSPDGRFLAAVLGGRYGLRIFEADLEWSEVFSDREYGDESYGVAFGPNGRLATVAEDGYLRLYAYDRTTNKAGFRIVGKPERVANGQRPDGLAFSPDGNRLAIGYEDTSFVDVLDAATLHPLGAHSPEGIHLAPNGFLRFAWSRDNQTLFATGAIRDAHNQNFLFSWDRGGLGDEHRSPYCGENTSSGLDVFANGNVLVATMLPCVSLMKQNGGEIWSVHAPTLDVNNQADKLWVSGDGEVVDFGDERYPSAFRFDTRSLTLSSAPSDDSSTFPPKRDGLAVAEWRNSRTAHIANVPIPLTNLDISRSLAIEPDTKGFYLGSSQLLRAFDAKGGKRWSRLAADGEAWAVNASRDGRLLVVAYGDGTIRWHRADDGTELLALQVLRNKGDVSQWDWVLWTPEGFYTATPGARDALRWVLNHGPDQAATTLAVSAIPRLHRAKALRLILETLDTALALGRDDIAAARSEVQTKTRSAKAPGPVLHVLTIGVDKYGQAAGGLHLDYAANDAKDVMDALFKSQTVAQSLYADVEPEEPLVDEKAGRVQIMDALDRVADSMRRHQPIQDVAVIFVSTHGEIIGDPGPPDHSEFYLAPYGFDIASANASASSALPLTAFADKISKLADYGKVLLLLDACHSGAAGPGGWMRNPNAERLRAAMVNQNVAVLTSSSENELSNELPEYGHGALAQAFLDALNAPVYRNGVVSLSALADKMDDEVESLTKNLKNQQHLGRNLNFNRKLFLVGGDLAALQP